eukprot:TRINITY_DN19042_c0_g1_i1.p1 TRINITY_DN19042_c0_g1~~TRINITY_DN19042_c0_g1_i1.p1  ORF type:complete len:206 (+),score=84.31 TRINITY_DN19042_c0_g1_i1:48-665(+)
MATVCTKHRPQKDVDDSAPRIGATLSPERVRPMKMEQHKLVLGTTSDKERFQTIKNCDYTHKERNVKKELEMEKDQRSRVFDMNTKHFVFGHAPQTMVSEVRGTMLAPSQQTLLDRNICPIGGPNNKGASNLFISGKDRDSWQAGITSTSRDAFKKTDQPRKGVAGEFDRSKHIANMRSSHFDMGGDNTKWMSTTQADFTAPSDK